MGFGEPSVSVLRLLYIQMSELMSEDQDHPLLHFLFPNNPNYWYDPGSGPPPCGVDARLNSKEDFAEAVTAYVYPSEASAKASKRGWPYHDTKRGYSFLTFADTPRGQYIMALLVASR